MTITKKILASKISSSLNLNKKESSQFVNKLIEVIKKNIKNKEVKINNFGTFKKKLTKKRIGRNPKTLKEYSIEPTKKVSFKPSFSIKKNIN